MNKQEVKLAVGRYWSVAFGNISMNPIYWASNRRLAETMKKAEGFVAVMPAYPNGTLAFFDSKNNAKAFRNKLESLGAKCGNNICACDWDGVAMTPRMEED